MGTMRRCLISGVSAGGEVGAFGLFIFLVIGFFKKFVGEFLHFGSNWSGRSLRRVGVCLRSRMDFEPAGNGGLADTEAMPGEEIRNCADAFSFAAQLPNDFGVVVELRAGRVRLQPLRYIEDLIFISHRHSWRSAGNV